MTAAESIRSARWTAEESGRIIRATGDVHAALERLVQVLGQVDGRLVGCAEPVYRALDHAAEDMIRLAQQAPGPETIDDTIFGHIIHVDPERFAADLDYRHQVHGAIIDRVVVADRCTILVNERVTTITFDAKQGWSAAGVTLPNLRTLLSHIVQQREVEG